MAKCGHLIYAYDSEVYWHFYCPSMLCWYFSSPPTMSFSSSSSFLRFFFHFYWLVSCSRHHIIPSSLAFVLFFRISYLSLDLFTYTSNKIVTETRLKRKIVQFLEFPDRIFILPSHYPFKTFTYLCLQPSLWYPPPSTHSTRHPHPSSHLSFT